MAEENFNIYKPFFMRIDDSDAQPIIPRLPVAITVKEEPITEEEINGHNQNSGPLDHPTQQPENPLTPKLSFFPPQQNLQGQTNNGNTSHVRNPDLARNRGPQQPSTSNAGPLPDLQPSSFQFPRTVPFVPPQQNCRVPPIPNVAVLPQNHPMVPFVPHAPFFAPGQNGFGNPMHPNAQVYRQAPQCPRPPPSGFQMMCADLEGQMHYFRNLASNAHNLLRNEKMRFEGEIVRKDQEIDKLNGVVAQAFTNVHDLNQINEHLKSKSDRLEERERMLLNKKNQQVQELDQQRQTQMAEIERLKNELNYERGDKQRLADAYTTEKARMASQIGKLASEVESKNYSIQVLNNTLGGERRSRQVEEERWRTEKNDMITKLNDVNKNMEEEKHNHQQKEDCWLAKLNEVMAQNSQLETQNWNLREEKRQMENKIRMGVFMTANACGLKVIDEKRNEVRSSQDSMETETAKRTEADASNLERMDYERSMSEEQPATSSTNPSQNHYSFVLNSETMRGRFQSWPTANNLYDSPPKPRMKPRRPKGPMQMKMQEANERVASCEAYKYMEIAEKYLYKVSKKKLPQKRKGKPQLPTIIKKLIELGLPDDATTKQKAKTVLDIILKEQKYQLEKEWIKFSSGRSSENSSINIPAETVPLDDQTALG